MPADVVVLFAAERSGTHLLRSMLSKSKGVQCPGEVANVASGDIRTSPLSFLKFRREACLASENYSYPTDPIQTDLIDRYVDAVREHFPGAKTIVLDVKYAHVHNFNSFWWDFARPPFLIEYADRRKMKIVHLVRERCYQTVISDLYAQRSGVWRARDPAEIRTMRIRIEPAQLEQRARRVGRTIKLFDDWLAQASVCRVTYESLVQDAPSTLASVAKFLGIDGAIPAEPGFLKTTPPYRDSIENYDEIAHLIDVDMATVRDQ
jgi:hypothetical protein